MQRALTDFETQVLAAVVEGYAAREGLKDRIRALNEWEIARRSGFTEISYAAYLEHPTREVVMQALAGLQRHGLVSVWERGAKYDTFIPTASGTSAVVADPEVEQQSEPAAAAEPCVVAPIGSDPIVERLDKMIQLLRSIDSKLGGL